MKRIVAVTTIAVAWLMLTPQNSEAQQFHRGFAGPGWGGGGVSINIGSGSALGSDYGPGFNHTRHRGFHSSFVNPGFYQRVPVQSYYRGSSYSGINSGFNRGGGFHYGRNYRPGCGW
ncbi:MAG: hypothetical protein ACI87E_001096 [Mariniblastus sp.]|jgi:hypothetical protein